MNLFTNIIVVLVAAIWGGIATMAQTANAVELKYHPRFGAIPIDEEVKSAITKFPDLASCLLSGAVSVANTKLDAIDWGKIRNDGDAKVCLFMIFEKLEGPEAVKAWLVNQGFSAWGPINQGRDHTLLRHFGYDVSNDVFNSYKNPGVGGGWSLDGQYPKFPTSGFTPYWRRVLSRAQNISATWFPDGKLMDVYIFYDSIFN